MSPLTLELLNLALKKYHDHTVSAFEKMNVADHVMRQLLPELLNQLEEDNSEFWKEMRLRKESGIPGVRSQGTPLQELPAGRSVRGPHPCD
jgi:hypothetical protein